MPGNNTMFGFSKTPAVPPEETLKEKVRLLAVPTPAAPHPPAAHARAAAGITVHVRGRLHACVCMYTCR
ncbi:hypothetical protein EON67_05710 [archaeon]|nr:MAG: hypothetical protein EON67_05710 [archaeon]